LKYQKEKDKDKDKEDKKSKKDNNSNDEHFLTPVFSAVNSVDQDCWLPDTRASDYIANSKS
jgi:hypothetical protein